MDRETIFWFCALLGSGLFVIQLLLSLFGAFDFEDAEAGPFKCLSRQAIAGFLMMFGWSGLTCLIEFERGIVAAVAVALAVGGVAFFVTAFLFRLARKLHSSGTVFDLERAVGLQAIVYQRIPKGGVGKISVSLEQLTHEVDAVADEEIPSFAAVKVVKKVDDRTVVVTL